MVQRYVPAHPNDDFAQPGVFFRKVLTNEKRDILISNIVVHLKQANRDVSLTYLHFDIHKIYYLKLGSRENGKNFPQS